MGRGDACPIVPGKRYPDWVLGDPAGRSQDPAQLRVEANLVCDVHRDVLCPGVVKGGAGEGEVEVLVWNSSAGVNASGSRSPASHLAIGDDGVEHRLLEGPPVCS